MPKRKRAAVDTVSVDAQRRTLLNKMLGSLPRVTEVPAILESMKTFAAANPKDQHFQRAATTFWRRIMVAYPAECKMYTEKGVFGRAPQ